MKKVKISLVIILVSYFIGLIISFVTNTTLGFAEHFTDVIPGVMGGAGIVVSILYIVSGSSNKENFGTGRTKESGKMSQYYDSRWVSLHELATDSKFMPTTYNSLGLVKKTGMVIRNLLSNGKLLINMYNPIHTLVIGTTGSGKTIIDWASN